MRLFVALDVDSEIRRRIGEFRDQMRTLAPDVRWVGPETFHVTLQFLGETQKLDEIRSALQQVKAAAVPLTFRSTGFFPNPKSPRVFWVGIESDEHLQELANSVGAALKPVGFERDAGPYKPHLTLARAGSGRPKPIRGENSAPGLLAVRVKLEGLGPVEFGTMTAHEFYLYESKLSPAGAQYTKIAEYPLE
ncbi:MAG: RNA 2',3'-cyclic phosphodiesterase [Candidatus Korobacteraceae bacterium]|jgi:RNA 2',3'-cyclic 3'-phosphodiesterase